ncbi:MAG: CocE/NonD family hydrolase [Acidobacteria bacterium]|nr:CocE/NonD family hydrolase [Acidobacteriota bacterium]
MDRRNATLLATIVTLLLTARVLVAADSLPVTIERNVTAKMRDGVLLRADIYRPKAEGKFPVLLQRTPYDKRGDGDFGARAAAFGYVVIIQDTRGRYNSDGDFYTFKYESNDGYDTVEWAAALPYSDGRVGMFGGSYVGATQMLAAIAHPPHLAGICPEVTPSNYHDGWVYQGGAFVQWFSQSWTAGLAQDTFNRTVQKNTNALMGMWKLPLTSFPLFNIGDSVSVPASSATLAPYYLDWLAHPNYDEYWKQLSIEEHYADIKVPSLTIAAWYDLFLGGSLRNYLGVKARGGSEEARKGQHLLITIGGHAGDGRKIGEIDFGPAAAEYDTEKITLGWYNYLFKGEQNEFAGKPVKIFVMGSNRWRQEDEWPLSRARNTRYYLHAAKGSNSLRGDGSLSEALPKAEGADHYIYDPANPAPTIGGPLCCDGQHLSAGPRDQRPVEGRDDVLIYTTPAFTQDTEITGPISVELFAQSSAVDTDFTAKLIDVLPDGYAQNLTEGIIRARYRSSQEKPELINPGQIYKFNIDLWSTSNVFLKGHKLRLEISSSNFPRFDRNLNTGEDMASGQHSMTATNTIYHDAQHPSALILPVVP